MRDEAFEQIVYNTIGAMIEVPSSVNLIPKISPMIDFLCVGTNDLLQYFVAADRTNALVQYLYKWYHPSFLVTLKGISKSSAEANCPVSICGEMAGEMWGITRSCGFRIQKPQHGPASHR